MIFALIFLIALFCFPDISFFALILFSVYLICTLLPEIADKAEKKTTKAVWKVLF